MLARPRMSVTQWVRPRQGILIRSILPLCLSTPHKMTRAGEGVGRRFALNCGPTSERKRKTKRVPFGERRGGSSVPGCNANATRAMYSQNRLIDRHWNHYSHQNLRCSAYASHCPKTTPPLHPIPPTFRSPSLHQASPSSPESHGAPQDHVLQDADAGAPRRNRGGGRR